MPPRSTRAPAPRGKRAATPAQELSIRESFPFERPLLLLGENLLRAESLLKRIRESAAAAGIEEIKTFHGDEITWGHLADELASGSLFGDRLIIVRRADAMKDDGPDSRLSALSGRHSGVSLVLLAESLDKRLKTTKLYDQHCKVVACQLPKDADLPDFIMAHALSRGWTVEPPAAALLAAMIGNEPLIIAMELEKLQLARGNSPRITEDDVISGLSHTRPEMPWTLSELLLSGQTEAALASLKRSHEAGTYAYLLLSFLSRQLRKLLDITTYLENGLDTQQIVKQMSLHPYFGTREIEVARKHPRQRITAALTESLRTEALIKSAPVSDSMLLDAMVLRMGRAIGRQNRAAVGR